MTIPVATLKKLRATAKAASRRAYCVYSDFPVGAAVLTAKGKVVSGCNVESASYGLTICAERNALGQLVMAGERAFTAVVVYTPTATPTAPCGRAGRCCTNSVRRGGHLDVRRGRGAASTVRELLPGRSGRRIWTEVPRSAD